MKNEVICLYDENGLSADEWARNGFDVYCYDLETVWPRVEICGRGRKFFMHWNATDAKMTAELIARHAGKCAVVLGFPPCTDLAVSGAKHFWRKELLDQQFQAKAMILVRKVEEVAEALGAAYCIENPVSMVSTFWRKPDFIFDPYEFGGYLPEDDIHPFFPEYIVARDAYPKKTCYWIGGGFVIPKKKPVAVAPGYSTQYHKLGGRSKKTKRIRSMSPRGVNVAIYQANAPKLAF